MFEYVIKKILSINMSIYGKYVHKHQTDAKQ